jgi:hypothetical protein
MEHVFTFIISLALVLAAVASWERLLCASGPAGFMDRAVTLFLFASANVVFSAIVLSEFQHVSAAGYLSIQAFVAVLSVLAATRSGRRGESPAGWKFRREVIPPGLNGVENITLSVLLAVTGAASLISLFLALYVPPGGSDALAVHLSRVAYWLERGTLKHSFTHDIRQLWSAVNADALILWTAALLKTDGLAAVFQWLSSIISGLLVYGVALSAGSSRPASIFSALVFLGLPMVMMESSSTQNELVSTAFLLSAFYFLDLGMREKNHSKLVVSALAFGLAVGAKEEALFFVTPALIVSAVVFAVFYGAGRKLFIRWLVASVGFVVVLGSYNYLQYNEDYGSALMPKYDAGFARSDATLKGAALHFLQMGYKSAEFAGLPEPAAAFLERKKAAFGKNRLGFLAPDRAEGYAPRRFSFDRVGPRHENFGWAGFLGFFLILPSAVCLAARSAIKKRFDPRLGYLIMPVFFIALMSFKRAFMHDEGRLFIMPLAFMAPAAALLWDSKAQRLRMMAIVAVSAISAYAAADAVLNNSMKPVLGLSGNKTVFDEEFRYPRTSYGPSPRGVPIAEFVDRLVAPGLRIGHVIEPSSPDYQFFGRGFANEVQHINPHALIVYGKQGLMDAHQLAYFVEEIDAGEADSSFEPVVPVFSPSGGVSSVRWRYRINAREPWDHVVGEWFKEKAVTTDDFTLWDAVTTWSLNPQPDKEQSRLVGLIGLLGSTINLSSPLRAVMDRASAAGFNDAVLIAGREITLNDAGRVSNLSRDGRVFSAIVKRGPFALFGSVSERGVVKIYEEGLSGKAKEVNVNDDGVFLHAIDDLPPATGGRWRLLRAEADDLPKPTDDGKGARFNKDAVVVDAANMPAVLLPQTRRALYVFDRPGGGSVLFGRVRDAGKEAPRLEGYGGNFIAGVETAQNGTFVKKLPSSAKAAVYRLGVSQNATLYGAAYVLGAGVIGEDGIAFIGGQSRNAALSGFYPVEGGTGATAFRWTDGEAEAIFTSLTWHGGPLKLQVSCLKKGPVAGGALFFNNKEVGRIDCGTYSSTLNTFTLPAGNFSSNGAQLISIRSKTFSPAELGNVKDTRRLGLAIREISVSPAR